MRDEATPLAVLVAPDDTVDCVIRRMANESRAVQHAGIAVVVDEARVLQGILTDGDIRRAYARNMSWEDPVSSIMIREPITLPVGIREDEIILQLADRVEKAKHLRAKTIKHILLVNDAFQLVGIRDFAELLWDREEKSARVHIVGLGFVGLTLAISLANIGHRVTGVDTNRALVDSLRAGESPVFEVGLAAKLKNVIDRGTLTFENSLEPVGSSIFIIAVGAGYSDTEKADLSAIADVAETLGKGLKPGDQIILRSTVPVGVTTNLLVPLLAQHSGLKIGEEINVSFCPERTLAGQAITELQSLPQIVGGVTPRCTEMAARFWSALSHSVIKVKNPEVAEMAKLANNAFRNVSFAFSNELSFLAEQYNVDVSEVINAANNGYPRNHLPSASPGVGGYCLPKDSMFFSESFDRDASTPSLGALACQINRHATEFPIRAFERFCKLTKLQCEASTALIIGIAFKGEPETNDLRGSSGLEVAKMLQETGVKVLVWDAVVTADQASDANLTFTKELSSIIRQADSIFVMNNHRQNSSIEPFLRSPTDSPKFLFDGWKLFDRQAVEAIEGMWYGAPGYLTASQSSTSP